MSRDYKNAGARPNKNGMPGWVWMLSGLAIGLFVALLVYLKDQPNRLQQVTPSIKIDGPHTGAPNREEPEIKDNEKEEPKFDFFTLLPEMEVVIPEGDYRVDTTEVPSNPSTSTLNGSYLLQAGSFRKYEQADKRKAELALMGFTADIQRVQVNDDYWHRVRVGPFDGTVELEAARQRLRDQNIQTIAVKIAQ